MLKTTLIVYVRLPGQVLVHLAKGMGRSPKKANQAAWTHLYKGLRKGYGINKTQGRERIIYAIETLHDLETGKQRYSQAFRPGCRYSYEAERYNSGQDKANETFLAAFCGESYQAPEPKPVPVDDLIPAEDGYGSARFLYFALVLTAFRDGVKKIDDSRLRPYYEANNAEIGLPNGHYYGARGLLERSGLAVDAFEPGEGAEFGTPYLAIAPAEYSRLMGLYGHR